MNNFKFSYERRNKLLTEFAEVVNKNSIENHLDESDLKIAEYIINSLETFIQKYQAYQHRKNRDDSYQGGY